VERTRVSSRRVFENILLTLGTQVISWGLTFLVTLYLPSYLKDSGLGSITIAGSFQSLAGVLVILGTSVVLVKEIARRPDQTRALVGATLLLRSLLALPACALAIVAALLMGYEADLRVLIALALGLMVVGSLSDAVASALRGLEEFRPVNAAALTERFIVGALTIALVFARAPLWAFVAVGFAGSIPALLWQMICLRRILKTRPECQSGAASGTTATNRETMRQIVLAGMPYFTNTLFINIYGNAAPLLLKQISSVSAVGWFGLAKRLGGTTMILPVALTGALLPTLSRLYHEDESAFRANVRRMVRLLLVSVMPFAAVLVLAPIPLLAFLHYPPMFRGTVPVLVVMGISVVLWYLTQAIGTALIAGDQQNVFSRVTGIAATVSFPLCAAGIWITERYFANGAVGAMVSDALLEAGMVLAYLRYLPAGTLRTADFAVLLRAGVAILPVLLVFHSASSLPSAARWGLIALSFAAYVPLCWVMRCFDTRDLDMIRRFIARRPNAELR
jgi:O-antigen/teichoic acid export membrane protein